MTEETFGPVVGIMPVDSDDQALALMNDSQYGLVSLSHRDSTDARPHQYGQTNQTPGRRKCLTTFAKSSKLGPSTSTPQTA
jgi:hypothetical protein